MYKINPYLELSFSKNLMEAYLTISKEYSMEESSSSSFILTQLQTYIKYGLYEEVIDKISLEKRDAPILIACGMGPIQGQDGSIQYHFSTEKLLIPKLLSDGTVDYKDLGAVNRVSKGDVLATITPPTDGECGINVLGQEIPAMKGKMPMVKCGKNTHLSEDGLQVIADVDGQALLRDGKIIADNTLYLDEIGVGTGNIDFDGSVFVKKDVLNGFILNASGVVEVKGKVEGGEVNTSSDLLIRLGIQGYNKYQIKTKGSLSTKFIENAIVRVNGNITAEAIMHSEVEAGGNILCIGKKGLIVGGVVKATYEIVARTIGSSMATITVIEVGTNPKLKERYQEHQTFLRENEPKLDSVNANINIFETLKKSNRLDENKLSALESLIQARDSLAHEIQRVKREMSEMEDEMKQVSNGRIRVSEKIYPGVKVVIGNAFMFIRDELQNCSLYREGADIRVGPY